MTSASFSAVSGVVSAGLRTTVLPQASAGAIFQAAISSGKIPRDDLPGDAERAAAAAGEGVVELVGPAGVIEKVRGGEGDIDIARFRMGLPPSIDSMTANSRARS
jgi:hypothetical protein